MFDGDQHIIESWLATLKSENTRKAYRRCAEAFLKFLGAPLHSATETDVYAFLKDFGGENLNSAGTIAGRLRSFLKFASSLGVISDRLALSVSTVRVQPKLSERVIDERSILKMLMLETNERNYALLLLGYSAGIRLSEVVSMKWADIELGQNQIATLHIPSQGEKGRNVRLSSATWAALRVLRGSASSTDPIFRSKKGGHLDPSVVHRIVKAAALRAELPPDLSLHWLRHSHAVHRIESGASVEDVQLTLGHTDQATTARYAR